MLRAMRSPHALFLLTALLGGGAASTSHAAPPSGCGILPNSQYTGRYLCAQGWTDMTLTVIDVEGNRVRMQGEFHHAASNTTGAYLLRGFCFPSSRRMVLSPQAWVRQPPGYTMVGMSGFVTNNGQSFAGRMTNRSCGDFTFTRQ